MTRNVHPGAWVDTGAELGAGVTIEAGAIVGPNVRIGDGTRIGSHALVTGWTRVGKNCKIHHGAVLGSTPQDLKYRGDEPSFLEVGDRTEIREFCTLNLATEPGATTRVGRNCLLMAYSHVAHNCHLGDHVIMANIVQLAGYVTVEDWVIIGGGTLVHQFVRLGCHAMVGGMSRVTQDVAPYVKAAGAPPRLAGINSIGLQRRGVSRETCAAIDRAYRVMFRDGLAAAAAVTRLRDEFTGVPEIEHLARFTETSVRGLTR